MKLRSEIEEKYKWDLSKYCKSVEDFYARLEKVADRAKGFKQYEGKLSDDNALFECLELETEIDKELSLLAVYASLKLSEDNSDRQANEMNEKMGIVISKFSTATSYVDVEISKFKEEKLKALQSNEKFKNYSRYFESVLREKKHTLSKREELLISQLGEFLGGFSSNFDKFTDVDLKFDNIKDSNGKEYEFNQSKYSVYVESKDRTLRENAFKQMNGKHGEFINFLANNYINDVKEDCIFAKIRKYKSALSASIYNEEADEKVYKLLVKKVRKNVGLLQRYFEVKRKMLNLDRFAIYDTFAPVVEEVDKKYSYDEAIELIKEAVSVLGDEYVSLIDRAKNERWIDVYPNKNKSSGAFSTGSYGANPVVLTNYEGNLESVFTLAHELGHAMHTYFSEKFQPIQTSNYVIFVAEVASNVNEMLLLRLLMSRAKTKQERIYYYDHFLKQMRSSIFRQTMFSEFEEFAHREYEKEKPLSPELLCEEYEKLNNFYHGRKVKQIPEMKYEWARIPHFFRSFYVYKYATGLICAIKISHDLTTNPKFYKDYLKFLSSGNSADPISLLKIADCDLTKEETFDQAFAACEEIIEKWEHELD